MKILRWVCIGVVMLQVAITSAPKLSVTASSTTAKVGDIVTIKIAVSAPDLGAVSPLPLPTIPGLGVVQSSDETVVKPQGDAVVMTKTRVIRFRVTQGGRIEIPSITLKFKGRTLQSAPLQLVVTGGARPAGASVKLVSVVSARKVVVGQAISYQLKVRRLGPFAATPTIRFPLMEGFFQVNHPVSKAVSKVQVGSQTWYETTIMDRTLYPSQPGRLVIKDAALTIPQAPVGGANTSVEAAPIAIDVVPLPSPKPSGFSGAVGGLRLDGPRGVVNGTQHSPVAIPLVVRGRGNLGVIVELIPPTHNQVKILKGAVTTQTDATGHPVAQRITYMAVIKRSGQITLPPFKLIVFSPEKGAYVTVQTQPIQLQISPGKSAIMVLDAQSQLDLAPHRTASDEGAYSWLTQWSPLWFWFGMGVQWLVVAGLLVKRNAGRYLARTMPARRRRHATDLARQRLRQLRVDQPNVWTDLRRVVTDCIADRYQIQIAHLVTSAVSDALTPLEPAARDNVVAWLSQLDQVAYQPIGQSEATFQTILSGAKLIVERIDRAKGEQR